MKLRRELSDLPFAGALTPHEGDLAAGGHYDGSHFTGGTTYTGTRADGGASWSARSPRSRWRT